MISLFNTATRRVQRLEPRDGRISLYVCGVTPYDTTHLGHAFTYVVFDVLIRYLRTVGIEVDYAQNVTDIDDDMMRKSRELGISYDRLAACEIEAYERDMEALNVLPPDYFIKASDVVQEIIEAIEGLERAGVTYEAGENLYFRAAGFPNYGSLAGADRERLIELAAEHGGNPRDPFKRDPLDFILWQAEQPVGEGTTGLAHRVQHHRIPLPRHPGRRPRRRQGPDLPPPRQRNRAGRKLQRFPPLCSDLDAHGDGGARRRQDEQEPRQSGACSRPAAARFGSRHPPLSAVPSLSAGFRL